MRLRKHLPLTLLALLVAGSSVLADPMAPPNDTRARAMQSISQADTTPRLEELYRLARALTEFDVDVSGAHIDTLGHDVVDSFYVTSAGDPIEDQELQSEISRALMHALEPPT